MKRNYLTITLLAVFATFCWVTKTPAADTAKTSDQTKTDATTSSDTTVVVDPSVTYAGVSGNKSAFREATGIKEGWSGGIEEFKLSSKINKDTTFELDGRGLFDAHDYKLKLELVKPESWFVRAGYTEWRKYYNDMGGYYATNSTMPAFVPQNQDLHVDMRKIFFEAGLTMPNLPKVTVGYERQEKEGVKSMLEWGSTSWLTNGYNVVNPGRANTDAKIYPSFKAIDESTDIVKLNVEQDIKKIHIADDFRYEHFQAADVQYDMSNYFFSPSGMVVTNGNATQTYYENYKNDLFNNTFHMDSHVNDKFYWSMGYMYNKFDGSDGMQDQVLPNPITWPANATINAYANYYTTAVNLNSDSHVLNANFMYEPCKTVILNAGIQGEYTDSSAFETGYKATYANPIANPGTYTTETDKRNLNETFGIRYVGLPFTTIYAEGNLTQEQTDYSWQLVNDAVSPAIPNLVEQINSQREAVKIGFNTSPISRVTWSTYYRHTISDDDFSYETQQQNFFVAQRTVSDEFVTKLTLRPSSRVMIALQYQLAVTDIGLNSVTQLVSGNSGRYQSSTYTLSTTVTPINRLYLTGLLSYQETKTISQYNGATFIAPYRGNVYTVLASAGYAIDDKTDVTLEYNFSYQNDFNYNVDLAGGYNYGTDDYRHSIKAGLKRKISKNVTGNLRYEYDENVENSTGGINNYRANVVTASCTIRF